MRVYESDVRRATAVRLQGGTMYQKVGLMSLGRTKDQGRFAVTNNEADKMMFKVPSLRNIEKTAPYFHDSSANTLDEAIRMMAKHQLGKTLDDQQVSDITAFLNTLTGPPSSLHRTTADAIAA